MAWKSLLEVEYFIYIHIFFNLTIYIILNNVPYCTRLDLKKKIKNDHIMTIFYFVEIERIIIPIKTKNMFEHLLKSIDPIKNLSFIIIIRHT
jgi:hypothetical protein